MEILNEFPEEHLEAILRDFTDALSEERLTELYFFFFNCDKALVERFKEFVTYFEELAAEFRGEMLEEFQVVK